MDLLHWAGSGSVLILPLAICGILYWRCKHPQGKEIRSPFPIPYTVPENPNIMHAKVGAIRTGQSSALGQETIGIQDSVGNKRMVLNYDMKNAFVEVRYSLEQYIGLKEDKLSSTTVDFIRSEGNLETKCLYWFSKPKMCYNCNKLVKIKPKK